MRQLTIVIPILNEAKNIVHLIPEIHKVQLKLNLKKFEILLIDDNSSDDIQLVFNKLKKRFKYLKLYVRKKDRDLSKSCILGFEKSTNKNILVMDGDLQHNPKYIKNLFNKYISGNFDIVIGSRDLFKRKNKGLSFIRKLFSIVLIVVINFLLGAKTADPMTGFFIFNKKIYTQNKKNLYASGYKILSDLIYSSKKKLKIGDISIIFKKRNTGESKMSLFILLKLINFILTRWLKKYFIFKNS
jgi:dolichol-phosphate mannosyltransferase